VARPFDDLEFLSDAALALSELGPEEDVFQFVADRLAPLAPSSLITTISYDPRAGSATVRAMVGPEDMQRLAREVAGDAVGRVLAVDRQARQILSEGRLTRVAEGMHQLTFRTWPVELARRFEERLGIRSVYGQPFSRQGDFLGAVAFASRAPALEHARLIEVFVRLAAVTIQRRRAEAQLRESEQRFRMLAENSRDVIFRLRVSPKLEFEYVSPATARLLGITPDELYADARLATPCLYPEAWLKSTPRELPLETVVAHCRRLDVWMEQKFTLIRDTRGAISVEGIARDITKRKQAEEALLEADRRKTEFLAMLSHELRNPLGAIRNGAYVIGHAEPGGEQAQRALAVIERQVLQLTRLIDDLLDMTRITRGKVRLQKERLALNELVHATVDDHASAFETNKIALEVLAAPADVIVFGDRTRIRQVIDNLLHNAAKFTPPGGRASVSVHMDSARKEAIVRVHNTGSSIPKELRASLFEPFVQADPTLDRSKGGLGLGLAIVKGLVEMHGGSVEVESDETAGTAFTIRLPCDTTGPDADRPRAQPGVPEAAPRRVLVIEDNADAAESLRSVLELHGNTVAIASTGAEGIEVARTFRPDVVLCDVGLPEMTGYDVARAIRADPTLRTLPLVALTGYATPDDVGRAREAGFDRHVAKPPTVEVLARLIAELAGRKGPDHG
jgi:PAS domain S-box-containing protein